MSFITLKTELEDKMESILESYRERLIKLDELLYFKTDERDDPLSKLYMSVNGISLKLSPCSTVLQGEDLDRFVVYMDLVRDEIEFIKNLQTPDKVYPSVISPEELVRCLRDDLLI